MPPDNRDARVERNLRIALDRQRKSARLVERHIAEERARLENAPAGRQARAGANPNSIFDMKMEWSIDHADRRDSWTWGISRDWDDPTWEGVIHPKLCDFEKLLWKEIAKFTTGTGHLAHHDMPIDQICEEAQLRLLELEYTQETIFRFRLGNKRRLWGFRIVNEFQITWYDPEHHIYPVEP